MANRPPRGKLSDIPDFSIFHGANECTTNHKPGSAPNTLVGGLMVSTIKLSRSARRGCPWCAIFWKAFQCAMGVDKAGDQDFIYWRFDGESFFEPWCTAQSASGPDGSGEFKIQIYTDHLPGAIGVSGQFPFKNSLTAQTNTEHTMSQIDYWRKQCLMSHTQCPPAPQAVDLPTRLLDISDLHNMRVVETGGQQGQYMCLTHRWGMGDMPIKSTTGNLEQMKQHIPFESLPATFRDAALVAQRFGVGYIWIDALCIVQDDLNDWEQEVAQMGSVYKNGLMTIAAAWASGPQDGLFPSGSTIMSDVRHLELDVYKLPFRIKLRRHLRYKAGHLIQNQEHDILERGWIMQERLLSTRIAYFGFNEVAWECTAGTACECEPILADYHETEYSLREPFNPKAAFSLSTYAPNIDHHLAIANAQSPELWHHIINAYTALDFTVIQNKFPALAGLCSEIARLRPSDHYLAGLWSSTFMADILWRRRKMADWEAAAVTKHNDLNNVVDISEPGKEEFQRNLARQAKRDRQIRRQKIDKFAPTWSWAAVNAQVEYERDLNSMDLELRDLELAELMDRNCSHVYGMGAVDNPQTASVTIRSKLAPVDIRQTKELPREYRLLRDGHDMAFSEVDYQPSVGFDNAIENGDKLYCLLIAAGKVKLRRPAMGRIYGLVLVKAEDSLGRLVFERVGMFQETFKRGKEWCVFDGITTKTDVILV
ncbi:hypothetical protein QQS21_006023 [Conoideocrella luteorostrata]|uniref:Heterokaryon incompatibility domain-containing protein n=1 Tax=Conoideocrella luteorostrata TaxID=1105319 RepID=A0AAJ0CNE7_9HYPO|nr:hypothetical protein QQS21_006023 [Conoideocrella luteorostrata]